MTRYSAARQYTYFGVIALALAVFSAWVGMGWSPAFVACAIFVFMASVLLLLAFRPAVEVQDPYLRLGKRMIPWIDVRRVDRTGWVSPILAVRLTLYDDTRILVIYPGDIESCKSLLRTLRRMSRDALIDGIRGKCFRLPPSAGSFPRRGIACCGRRMRWKSSASTSG